MQDAVGPQQATTRFVSFFEVSPLSHSLFVPRPSRGATTRQACHRVSPLSRATIRGFRPSLMLRWTRCGLTANLNYGGVGAVLASPDGNVLNGQGGSYRFHWSRDGALSMRTLLETFVPGVTNSSLVMRYMLQYTKFILRIHSQPADPFNQSILSGAALKTTGHPFVR